MSVVSEDTNIWGDIVSDKKEYLSEASDIDFTGDIKNVAESIQSSSGSSKQAIRKSVDYVHDNIKYSTVSIVYCYTESSSDVLKNKKGDCVSMAKLLTSLLRHQGIPARTVGGCIRYSSLPSSIFSFIPVAEYPKSDIIDNKKRGYLHEWVEAWTPSEGWVLVDATIGMILDKDNTNYLIYGYDSNAQDRCVLNDNEFIKECRQ